MKYFALALLLVSTAASAADQRLAGAFRAAFGKNASVILKNQGTLKESVKYTPGDLVDTAWGPVLLAQGEVQDATHANWGKLAIVYLKPAGKGFAVVNRFVPATEIGSFGKIVDYSVSNSFGPLPIVSVNGAGNWQGYACSLTTMLELTPAGPKRLVTVPMTYDNAGAVGASRKLSQISGRIDNISMGRGFDVVYFGSKSFTDHYVRSGDSYVLASGGRSRMQVC
jgi:hypothetical protein